MNKLTDRQIRQMALWHLDREAKHKDNSTKRLYHAQQANWLLLQVKKI